MTCSWDNSLCQLHEIARFYNRVIADLKLEQVKFYTASQQTFSEEEWLFISRISKVALNVILLFSHPDFVKEFSRTRLKNKLISETDKKFLQAKVLKYAEKLLVFA